MAEDGAGLIAPMDKAYLHVSSTAGPANRYPGDPGSLQTPIVPDPRMPDRGAPDSGTLHPVPGIQRKRIRDRLMRAVQGVLIIGFFAYIVAFLLLPSGEVLFGAFRGEHGLTLKYVDQLFEPRYLHAFRNSIELALATAILGGLFGTVIAYLTLSPRAPTWLRTGVTSFSGVAANFAGVPLAFAFVSTFGTMGLLTVWLRQQGFNLYDTGFSLFSLSGLVLTYLYFQIPLMVIIITPAVRGLRREWREAASNLGATPWQYWRYVGLPILLPALLASMVLLFGNAFAAYATPYALTSGNIALVPIEIGNVLSGNVMSSPQLGQALALGMIGIMAMAMLAYTLLQRHAARWQCR